MIAAGDRVRPAADGSARNWTELRGTVVRTWTEGRETIAEVRWDDPDGASYGTNIPADLLVSVD